MSEQVRTVEGRARETACGGLETETSFRLPNRIDLLCYVQYLALALETIKAFERPAGGCG